MELSILVAKILSLTYLSAGVAVLSGKLSFSRIAEDFEKSPALTFISGFVTLIIGMLLVEYHNIWMRNWIVLITLVGWLSLVKGVMLIAYPRYISLFKGWYKKTLAWGFLMLALGFLFGYFGFVRP